MKVVINKCYGGFGLSPRAIKRLCELKGRECHFFSMRDEAGKLLFNEKPRTISVEEAEDEFTFLVYDTPNAPFHEKDWSEMSDEERRINNEECSKHSIEYDRSVERHDPDLVRVIEELGNAASGKYARLRIVEIPDGIVYEIDEYDGIETIHEVHRSWA